MSFWRPGPGGVNVAVKVKPRARRAGIEGAVAAPDGARLAIAVSEPPEEGRANRAACVALAHALGVPPSAVSVAAGASARRKILLVAGDPAGIVSRLARL